MLILQKLDSLLPSPWTLVRLKIFSRLELDVVSFEFCELGLELGDEMVGVHSDVGRDFDDLMLELGEVLEFSADELG